MVSPLFAGIPDRVEAHELSSIFTILALGAMMDASIPPDHPSVDRYANYGKLCLSLECIFGQTSVATIEANLLRLIFLLFSRDRTAPMKVFAQLGLIGRLIISMGMRGSIRSNEDSITDFKKIETLQDGTLTKRSVPEDGVCFGIICRWIHGR
jgi:hypothetical protein